MATTKGGDKLSKKLQEIAGNVAKGSFVKVGFLAGATYPDGKPVAMIAAIQDFGAPGAGIPPRPFFRNMIAKKKGEWPGAIATALKDHDYDGRETLEVVGQAVAGQLRQSIVDTNAPPLKPATIVRKGGTAGMKYDPTDKSTFPAKPLVNTGHMLNSVDHEVEE